MVESYDTISVSTKINTYVISIFPPLHSLSDCYSNIEHHYFPLLKCF